MSGNDGTCGMPARIPVLSIPSPSFSSLPAAPSPLPPAPRRHRRRRRSEPTFRPSALILGFLVSAACSASPVGGHPIPSSDPLSPGDLYPTTTQGDPQSRLDVPSLSLGSVPCTSERQRRRRHSASPTATGADYHIPRVHLSRRTVPDRFEEGKDGRWRKMTTFDASACAQYCATASSSGSPVLDEISSSTSQSSDPAFSNLPKGWRATPASTAPTRTAIIAVLSVVLTCLILTLITGLTYWRAKRRREARRKDPEKYELKKRKKWRDDSDEDESGDRQPCINDKLWAKASVRWRSNVRNAVRRRRAHRRGGASISATSTRSQQQGHRDGDESTAIPSRSPSPVSSLHPSVSASEAGLSSGGTNSEQRAHPSHSEPPQPSGSSHRRLHYSDVAPSPPPPPTPPLAEPPLPPAYPSAPITMSERRASKSRAWEPEQPEVPSPAPNFPAGVRDSPQAPATGEPAYSPSSHMAAHVATDDKTALARMAGLASAPPALAADVSSVPATHVGPSVPEWRDEELADFADSLARERVDTGFARALARPDDNHERSQDAGVSLAQSPFPAPPAHGKLAAPEFYEYPAAFEEDVTNVDGAAGPSAPPFEAGPSAPPLDDAPLVPSAPFLDDDDSGPDLPSVSDAAELDLERHPELAAPYTNPPGGSVPDDSSDSARAEMLPSYDR